MVACPAGRGASQPVGRNLTIRALILWAISGGDYVICTRFNKGVPDFQHLSKTSLPVPISSCLHKPRMRHENTMDLRNCVALCSMLEGGS